MPDNWWPGYRQRGGRQTICVDASWLSESLHLSAKQPSISAGRAPKRVFVVEGLEWVSKYKQDHSHRVGMVRASTRERLRRRRSGKRGVVLASKYAQVNGDVLRTVVGG